jgi:hypothetical protein
MNKKNIVEKLPTIIGSSSQAEDIIKAIAEAMEEWESARAYFQIASEPKLVDYAIYLEAAARSRYSYLIGEAREKGITVDSGNMLKKIIGI